MITPYLLKKQGLKFGQHGRRQFNVSTINIYLIFSNRITKIRHPLLNYLFYSTSLKINELRLNSKVKEFHMSEVKWIAHNIEIIKKDIRSARELRESQKFYMYMDLEQDLMDAYDLTLLLRQCFGPSFDPSIIFFKFNVKTQTIYILRENEAT